MTSQLDSSWIVHKSTWFVYTLKKHSNEGGFRIESVGKSSIQQVGWQNMMSPHLCCLSHLWTSQGWMSRIGTPFIIISDMSGVHRIIFDKINLYLPIKKKKRMSPTTQILEYSTARFLNDTLRTLLPQFHSPKPKMKWVPPTCITYLNSVPGPIGK